LVNSAHLLGGSGGNNHSQRSGSQASSGYQSQSPVLEGEGKGKSNSQQMGRMSSLEQGGDNAGAQRQGQDNGGLGRVPTPLSFSNPGFTNRKSGSQSVDDLSSVGVEGGPDVYKKR
jgi:hypothetical protein